MSSLPALAAMPAYYTLDPLLGGSGSLPPGFLPLADAGPDSFMPPLHSNSSQGAASSGMDSGSAGTGGPAAGIAAAAVVTSGRRGKAGGGGGGAGGKKELTEEQKERIKAKNRRWVGLGSRLYHCTAARLCGGGPRALLASAPYPSHFPLQGPEPLQGEAEAEVSSCRAGVCQHAAGAGEAALGEQCIAGGSRE